MLYLKYILYWCTHRFSTLLNTTFNFTKYYDLTSGKRILCPNYNNVYESLCVNGMFNGKQMRFVCHNISINDISKIDFSKFSFTNYFNITKIMYNDTDITNAKNKFYSHIDSELTLDELLHEMVKMYLIENNLPYKKTECVFHIEDFDEDTLSFEKKYYNVIM